MIKILTKILISDNNATSAVWWRWTFVNFSCFAFLLRLINNHPMKPITIRWTFSTYYFYPRIDTSFNSLIIRIFIIYLEHLDRSLKSYSKNQILDWRQFHQVVWPPIIVNKTYSIEYILIVWINYTSSLLIIFPIFALVDVDFHSTFKDFTPFPQLITSGIIPYCLNGSSILDWLLMVFY